MAQSSGMSGLGSASLILGIGGALSSTIGSFYSASAQKNQLKAQAITADTNARIAELGAQTALNQGQFEVGSIGLQAGQLKSTQRASMAANGIDLGSGNAAEVLASTDIMKQVDQNTAMTNAIQQAWGYRMQGTNYQNEAITDRATASGINPGISAFSTLLSGAGQVSSNWYTMKSIGALGNSGVPAQMNAKWTSPAWPTGGVK